MRNLAINNATILMILILGLIAVFVSRSDLSIRIGDDVSMLIRESDERKNNRQKGGCFWGLQRSLQHTLHVTTLPTTGEYGYRLPEFVQTAERDYICKRRSY